MKYFTIQWARGEYSSKKHEKMFDKYLKNIEKIKSQLPERAYFFAKNVDLHDGLIKQIAFTTNVELEIIIISGDLQKGYTETSIKYNSAFLESYSEKGIFGDFHQNKPEILMDEIDISGKVFVHRFLTYPFNEFDIHFSGFEFTQKSIIQRT